MRDKKFSFIIKFLIILTYISTEFLLIVSLQLKNTSSNTKDFVPVEKITQHIRLEYGDNRIEYVNTPKQVFTKEEDFRFSSKNEREYEKAERKMKWKRRRQNR